MEAEILEQLEVATNLATELFGNKEQASEWMVTPNHIFFDYSPLEMILGGKGSSVIATLREWRG